jgi:RHS repeat-associated protein
MVERSEGGNTTRYYYSGSNMIAEGKVNADGSVSKIAGYARGIGLNYRTDQNGNKSYYVLNGQGDVEYLQDSTGNILNSYTYDLWGKPIERNEQVSIPFLYSGEYWDSSTELQNLRARWYDPGVGRFINEDTYEGELTNPLSENLYTYVHNNPVFCFLRGKLKNMGISNKSA